MAPRALQLAALGLSLLLSARTEAVGPEPVSVRLEGSGPELELELEHLELSAQKVSLQLRVRQNRALLPSSAQHVLHFSDGRTEVGPLPENCFYIGEVVGEPTSSVALSTCGGGVSGLIFKGNQSFLIHPEERFSRKLTARHQAHWLRRLSDDRLAQMQSDVWRFLNMPADPTRRLTGSSTKYVEVLAVNDFSRYTAFGGSAALADLATHTVSVLNAVTTIYRAAPTSGSFAYSIQVVLVAQHTFVQEDPWHQNYPNAEDEVDQAMLLEDFLTWSATQMAAGSLPENDNRVLLSGRDFAGSTVGYAPVSSMCDLARSGSINMCSTTTADVPHCAAVVAHELGHNFGMSHDAGTAGCPQSGFVMAAVGDSTPAEQFTACSASDLSSFFEKVYDVNSPCLENKPTKVFGDPVCGNGFREEGEDCDCGSSDCATADPCCDGSTCQFVDPGHECSDSVSSCCENCKNVTSAAQKVCRSARNDCDIAEVCPGGTSMCPKDEYVYPGATCTISSNGDSYPGLCAMGSCKSMRYTCEVDVTRDFEGNWDLSEDCASFNDDCSTVVCHDASKTSASECGQRFSVHGAQMAVPDGTPCWHPSEPKGQRTGMCYQGHCQRPESLAVVALCGNGGIDFGEQCDCGPDAAADPCCNCATCELKPGSACAGTDACCDPATCSLKSEGSICRAAVGECDIAEVCSGAAARCPPDVGKLWGTSCISSTVPSTCYANVCLPSLDQQCVEKTGAERAFAQRDISSGSRGDAPGHLCTALMCCAECVQETGEWTVNGVPETDPVICSNCLQSTLRSTFTVNGVSKSINLAAAVDGTLLGDSLCIQAEATAPVASASCSSDAYFQASIGRCLLCDAACIGCTGPSNLDCLACAEASKDSRGACPPSLEASRSRSATISTTSVATGTTGTETPPSGTGAVASASLCASTAGLLLPLLALAAAG